MKRLYDRLCKAEAVVAGLFLVLMVVLIFLACFFCADIAWRNNSLMSIEVVTSRLPATLQTACRMLSYALIAAFLVYLVTMGIYLSWISRIRSFQGIPGVSYSWVTMSLPVGALLLLVTTMLKVRSELRGEHAAGQAVDVL